VKIIGNKILSSQKKRNLLNEVTQPNGWLVGWLVDFLAIWLVSYEPSEDQ